MTVSSAPSFWDSRYSITAVLIGLAGWVILLVPDLHFFYKDYLGLLGSAKFAALLIAALGMFVFLPCWLVHRLTVMIPALRGRTVKTVMMIVSCIVSAYLGRLWM